jgi:hypothetical protein
MCRGHGSMQGSASQQSLGAEEHGHQSA